VTRNKPAADTPGVGFVSLGCPKALVDSERILTRLRADGYRISPSYQGADVVVVNTCGFIDSAREESLDAIAEAMAENGRVIVTGCLGVQADQIRATFPDVLAVTGPQQYQQVLDAIHESAPIDRDHDPYVDLLPPQGIRLTPPHYAYLKISEGCNHRCTFCIIPSMRGRLVSRPAGEILREAEQLVASGRRELLVISQDTSAYGVDLRYASDFWGGGLVEANLKGLVTALGSLGVWVRLHYVYPYPHVDDVIPLMAEGLLLPYLDVPFQHASPRILKLMKRPAAATDTLERVRAWRRICPELTLRSTFIVGFPGETEADFETLLAFLEEAQLDRVGCFRYSAVDGARANDLPDPVPEELKHEREARFMAVQAEISRSRLAAKVGTRQAVIIDEVNDEEAIGRSTADAPEIDGVVRIRNSRGLGAGDLIEVLVESSDDHDLVGRLLP